MTILIKLRAEPTNQFVSWGFCPLVHFITFFIHFHLFQHVVTSYVSREGFPPLMLLINANDLLWFDCAPLLQHVLFLIALQKATVSFHQVVTPPLIVYRFLATTPPKLPLATLQKKKKKLF